MGLKVEDWILIELILVGLIDIPDAYSLIVRSTEQETFLHWVPSQPISFLGMSSQAKIWFNLIVNRCLWMFVIIEKIYFTIYCFCCYYLLILRHIPCSVNFSRMINLYINRYSSLFLLCDSTSSDSNYSFSIKNIFPVVSGVFARFKRNFYLRLMKNEKG